MDNKKSDRRSIFEGVAVGTAWFAPVIQSVVIPLHAATTEKGDRFKKRTRFDFVVTPFDQL